MTDPKLVAANERVKALSGLIMNLAAVLIAYTVGDWALNAWKPVMIIWLAASVAMVLAALKALDLIQAEE